MSDTSGSPFIWWADAPGPSLHGYYNKGRGIVQKQGDGLLKTTGPGIKTGGEN